MKSLIKNLFQKKSLKLPEAVLNAFVNVFNQSKNIEWSKTGKFFEALFYDKEIEKIARFDKAGSLIEIRTNIPPSELPEPTKALAASKGEIMNAIIIKKENEIFYEVIVRKNPIVRILLLISNNDEILSRKLL